jgi:hypothetical protein
MENEKRKMHEGEELSNTIDRSIITAKWSGARRFSALSFCILHSQFLILHWS